MANRDRGADFEKIIKFGVCIDNDDPMRGGRIRARADQTSPMADNPVEQSNTEDQTKGEWNFKRWSEDDPRVFAPFLPLHLNVVPKIGEAIKILHYDPENPVQNKEYIGPLTSQPHWLYNETFRSARLHTSLGRMVSADTSVTTQAHSAGVFPNPLDIAIQGRNNTDIILGMGAKLPKKQRHNLTLSESRNMKGDNSPVADDYPQILIRSGKRKPITGQTSSTPLANDKMTFIQLNTFPQKLEIVKKSTGQQVTIEDAKLSVLFEYDIPNSFDPVLFQNSLNNIDMVVTFQLFANRSSNDFSEPYMVTHPDKLNANFLFTENLLTASITNIDQTSCIEELNRLLQSFDQNEFNEFIKPISGCTNPIYGFTNGVEGLKRKLSVLALKTHPLYFRPGQNLVNFWNLTDPNAAEFSTYGSLNAGNFTVVRDSIKEFIEKIELSGVETKGFGLAFDKSPDSRDVPTKVKEVMVEDLVPTPQQEGIISMGSEKIYLLSHDSNELGEIKLSSNYGISQYEYSKTIEKSTSGLVRGDKLLELLEEIVEFVTSHTHNMPGNPPIPTSHGGTTTQEILNKLLKAPDTVINKNIRIN